jgi:molecular chaperone DnaK (HSP70)
VPRRYRSFLKLVRRDARFTEAYSDPDAIVFRLDDDGAVVVLPNANGGEITPSAVYFEPDGTAVVGEEAVQATAVDPENGVQLIKRAMGTEFPLLIRGQQHTPESVSALILRQLITAATGASDKVSAVITVPAYFGLGEREATYQAGLIAGIDVLELLDEPVAAAAHYGLTSGADRTVLVYDLGGGTFDTTVLRISGGAVQVLATDGHHSLGGADVDQRLVDVILERLGGQLLPDELDHILDDKKMFGELVLQAEAAKKDLSARTSRPVIVRTSTGRVSVTITRTAPEPSSIRSASTAVGAISTDTPGIPRNAISSIAALFSESSTIRTADILLLSPIPDGPDPTNRG